MSHLNSGLLSTYNSLTDKHLAGYFSNTRIRRHLQRAGLITRSGRIVPDKEYRHKLIQRAHQRHVRECLAQAIFHKVLEMERLHQIEIKRKLEEFARRERVHKIKVECSKRYEEGIVHILSPHPPTGARGIRKQHSGPEGEHSESSESPSSSRPNTAPGKMQRPVRLKPIHSNSTTASVRHSSPYRLLESSHENHQQFNCTMEKEPRRRLTAVEASHGISPYCLPVISNFVTPVPPATKRKERGLKGTASSTVRGRRLRPTTASSGADDTPLLRSSVHQSRVCVNMVYFGKTVRLSSDLTDMRDDVKVFQQHCGGENLCVYKGKLHEGETFQFISRRHRGFPFSLTFFLNGLQVERLSSCCEFKHRKGSRLGGKHGHFGFTSVEGASPCYKCIIAMGLDKKPTPPPKTIKEDTRSEESVNSVKDEGEMETEKTGEDAGSHLEGETSEPQNMETPVKKETACDEEKDYEEDFEADDERPAEETKEEKSPSPASETDRQVKEKDASETENDDRDDMRSHSGSSSSGSEHEESDAEATRDIDEDKKAEQQKEDSQEETIAQPEEKDEPNPEDVATEAESSAAKDSHMDSAGDSTEIEISDTSVPSGSETRQSDDKDAERTVEEGKQEEEQERAKSVQEKLAEAILKESQCSSEPELSDTSTEEEEESTHKGPRQDNKDAAPDKLVTLIEQQQTIAEDAECEECDTGEVSVAQPHEDLTETKEQSGDDEQEPHENRDITEKVEEDDKAAEDKATEEEDKPEETGEALHPSKEENVTQDDKTTEPLEETPAETTDTEAAEKDEKKEEKTAEETDVQHDETGQGAKSSEEDESSVSELDKKTDETAAPDNAEAVTARETIEIKAESSKEQEALSYEEAPVSDAEKGEQAGSEDRAAGSETEVTAENSSSSPSGSGETTVEKIADTSEENAIEESSKDDIKEEQILEDDCHEEQCELGEEGIGASEETDEKEDKEKTEEGEKEEEENRTHVTSDKVEEDENTEKRDDDEKVKNDDEGNEESKEDEGTDKQENAAQSADNAIETKEDEEEALKFLSKEDKVADDEKVEEPEKTENDENGECDENKLEESEVMEGDKSEGDNENETKSAVQENDDEAENSENMNENKAEKSEDKESKNDEEDDKEKDISEKDITEKSVEEGEEISGTTEEAEKSADVGANEVADGTKSADETPEAESVEQDSGKASNTSEKGEVNAENGEIATEAGSNYHEDEGESQLKDKSDLKTKEEGDEESKTDEPADDESTDIKEVAVESEESAKKQEADEVDQAPGADDVEGDAKEEGGSMEKNDESTPSISKPETADTEMKEEPKLGDRKDGEEAEQDQHDNRSGCDHENKEPDLIIKESSTEENMDEVTAVSSGNQEQSPIAVDLDVMASKLDEESKDTKSDICPQADENVVGGDLSAADGENGVDAEDASKASEEGASVLLKPHAQNNEADNTKYTGKESPEALAKEDSTDLVSNWVNKHQSSKFFETFVEPLEDMREEISDTPVSSSNKEETKSTEMPRSESPLKMVRVSQDEVKAYRDVEHELEVEEKTEVKDLIVKAETEQSEEESVALQEMRSEEHKGSMGSLQECNGESAEKGINEENSFSKTEVESTSGNDHSATGKRASVSKSQTDEKTTDNDFSVKEPQTEEGHQSTSPLGTEDVNETWGKADEQSREVTETTDFTTSKSDDGSPEDSRNEEIEGTAADRSVSRDRKDLQLIEDIKRTLSKDRLSAFSVDDTLFAHSSYPLLTAASAESGH